jgi:hypothetical protein
MSWGGSSPKSWRRRLLSVLGSLALWVAPGAWAPPADQAVAAPSRAEVAALALLGPEPRSACAWRADAYRLLAQRATWDADPLLRLLVCRRRPALIVGEAQFEPVRPVRDEHYCCARQLHGGSGGVGQGGEVGMHGVNLGTPCLARLGTGAQQGAAEFKITRRNR